MKTLIQFFIIALAFFASWYFLSKVDWVQIFQIEKVGKKTEEKLGEILWDFIKRTEKESDQRELKQELELMLDHICKENYIDSKSIKLFVIKKDEVNAFALPNNIMVVYTGLISACEQEEELMGVLSHELAHMQHQHVMQKLMKEIGLSVLIGLTTQNANIGGIAEVARVLSSTAFDRSLEKEADLSAVDYLVQAGVDPAPFANFLFRLSMKEPGFMQQLSWLSTHPGSEERSGLILESLPKEKQDYKRFLGESKWASLKESASK
jgi:beta-barrel assembly-enhancing protease